MTNLQNRKLRLVAMSFDGTSTDEEDDFKVGCVLSAVERLVDTRYRRGKDFWIEFCEGCVSTRLPIRDRDEE